MAREWTERHIRELVRQEMKGFESGPDFPYVQPSYYGVSISRDGYVLSTYIPKLFGQTAYIPTPKHVEEEDCDYFTFRYVIQPLPQYKNIYWKGKHLFAILPFHGIVNSTPFEIPDEPYEIPLKKGAEPLYPTDYPIPYRGVDVGTDMWVSLFAYQNGKYFGLETISDEKVSDGSASSNVYVISTIFVASDRILEEDKYKNSFSPWSEYNWDKEEHYLCYNLGYPKERR